MSDTVVTTNHEKSADVIVANFFKRRTEQLKSTIQNGCSLDSLIDTGENVKGTQGH